MELKFKDELSMRRCRVVTEYPHKDSKTGRRWDENTPLIINTTFQGKILPISRLWTTVAYFPFPEAPELSITIPDIPVISEEQNCSLEMYEGDVPSLHFEMWQKGVKNRPTDFTNRAYNLCLGMDRYKAEEEDMWDVCKNTALDMSNKFCAPGHHPLHKSARYHFFDQDYAPTTNNLPLLLVQQQVGQTLQLKPTDELATLILSNAVLGCLPFVSPSLGTCIRGCVDIAPREEWKNNLEEALTILLWSGNHNDLKENLVKEFHTWCAGNRHVFPVWAVHTPLLKECPKNAFFAAILDTVAVYQHDYGLPHLSDSAFGEEVKQLRCDSTARSFTWESGHSRSTLLTSDWVKRKLHIQTNQTMEVKTNLSFGGTYSGERLDLSLHV